jgi:hypothetical protein
VLPDADVRALESINKYANQATSNKTNVFDRVNFNYKTFAQASKAFPNGIPQGTKIVGSGIGGVQHVFEAKYSASNPP